MEKQTTVCANCGGVMWCRRSAIYGLRGPDAWRWSWSHGVPVCAEPEPVRVAS